MNLTLVNKRIEAQGTKTFFFEPQEKFEYTAGQYIFITLPKLNYPDERGGTRHFTLSSPPTEKLLSITSRMREGSGYKKTLDELPMGTVLSGRGPYGEFTIDNIAQDKPNIFLAGGIGVTPFRSMIRYIVDKNLSYSVLLIYSNSVPEQIAFKDELAEIAKTSQNVGVAMSISHPENSSQKWEGLTGRIDEKLISEQLKARNWKLKNCVFWLAGPPPMVSAMEDLLSSINVPQENIKSEKFTGY